MAEPIKKTINFSGKVIDQDEFIRRAQEKAVAWMDYQGLQGAERQSFLANFNNKIRSIATGQEDANDTEIVAVETNKVRNGFDPGASVDTYLNGIAGAMPESKTDENKPALLPYNANTMGKYIQDSIFGEGHEVSEAQLNAWADAHDPYTKGQDRSTAARNQFINQQLLAYRQDILDGKYDMSEEEKKKEIANIDKLTSIDTQYWEKTKIAPWLSNLLFTTEKYGVEPTDEATVPAESSTPVVEEATGETNKTEQKQKQKQNPIKTENESPVAFTTNKSADWARVGSFITDLVSLGGGWFDLASIGSLGLDLYADIASGESAETTVKNALINTIGGAAALVPGLGSAKFIKYGKYVNGILAGLNAMGIVMNDDARSAIVKLCKGESITSDDLTALTNLGRQATGLTGSVRNMRAAIKNAKYKPKEHVKVETTSGKKVYLSKKHAAEMNKVGNGKNGKAKADKYLQRHAVDNKGNKVELDENEGLKNSPFNETNGVIHRTAAKTPLVKNFVANKVDGKSVSFHTQSQLDDIARMQRLRALHRKKHPVSDFLFNRAGFAVGKNNPGVYFDIYTKGVDIPSGKPRTSSTNSTLEVEAPKPEVETPKPEVETPVSGEKPATEPTEIKVGEEGKLVEAPKPESKDAAEVIEETVKSRVSEEFNPSRSGAKTNGPSPGSPEAKNIIDAINGNHLSTIRNYIKKYTKIKIKHKDYKSNQNLRKAMADLKKANHSSEEIMTMLTNKQFVERLRESYKFKQGGLIPFFARGGNSEEAKTTSTASSNPNEIIETTGDLSDEIRTDAIEGTRDIVDVVDSNPNGKGNLQKPTVGNKSDFLLTELELGKYLDSRINNYAIKNLYKKLLPVHKIFPQAEYRIWSPKQNLDFAQLIQNKSTNLGALQAKGTADQGQAFASQLLGWKQGMEQALPYYKQYNNDLKESVDTAISINNDNTEKRVDVANSNRAADVAKHNQDILADIQYKHDNATKFQQLASIMQNGIAKGAQAKYENDYRSYLTTDKDIIAAKEAYQLALDRYNANPTTENSNALTAATSRYNSVTSQKSNAWLAAHRSSLGYPFAPAIYTSPISQGFDFGSGFNFKDGGVLQENGRMKRHYDKLFYRAQRLLLTESNKKQKAMGNGYAYFQKIMMQGKP